MATRNSFASDLFRQAAGSVRAGALLGVITLGGSALHPALADENCTAPTSWFPQQHTPRPDDSAFQSTSNCVFHQWAYQMFLWLTQEWEGQPRFLSFQSPQSLLGMTQRGGLMPRMTKSDAPESFDEFLQAGPDGILVDQNGRAVYYSQYINETFAGFITNHHLTNPAVVRLMDPDTEFPITGTRGSLELKASWKVVAEAEDTSDMFTMTTNVAKLVNRGGKIAIDPSKTETVKVALVGFHIGGVVKGHPEMIWATFEHKDNAPDVAAGATPETVVSDKDFTFYRANTKYADCNVNMGGAGRLTLDEATQTLNPPTQVCRLYPQGNDTTSTDSSVKTNDQNIRDMNASVHAQLAGDSIWRNYYEVGAIWFLDGTKLNPGLSLDTDDLLTGSLKLSNATIETFTQTQNTKDNCFRCHNTQQSFPADPDQDPLPATNLNISHAFQNVYYWSQETTQAQGEE
ncbi:MAG: hypothetical protein U9Q81_19570 [Pseudomonadota bacterium]|nr:hypothetical protein [Pseudomonadota bacterium]